ncbi:MAG TPA: hypothetical protein VES36_07160, partial [Candidatus Limnocylindrales bacterium]|nr:hypothetical protein [Candidatus Limnocylindrales bacterium]
MGLAYVLLLVCGISCTAHQPNGATGSEDPRLAFDAFFRSPQFNEWFTSMASEAGKPRFVLEATPVMLPVDERPPREWIPPVLWSGL